MRWLLISLAIAGGVWLLAIVALLVSGRGGAARELATFLPHLVGLFRGLLKDPDVPRSAKVWLWVGIAWVVSPIDLIPEFLPVVGPLDDALVAAIVLRRVVRKSGADAIRRNWGGGEAGLEVLLRLGGVARS
jgi:uncharacterized membrane protein YkvA (DUF1232 family)